MDQNNRFEKETLFLRIKKSSVLEVSFQPFLLISSFLHRAMKPMRSPIALPSTRTTHLTSWRSSLLRQYSTYSTSQKLINALRISIARMSRYMEIYLKRKPSIFTQWLKISKSLTWQKRFKDLPTRRDCSLMTSLWIQWTIYWKTLSSI